MEALLLFKQSAPLFFYTLVAATGLAIGSFINVLVFRLPKIMDTDWAAEADAYLASKSVKHDPIPRPDPLYTRLGGRSYCPHCGEMVPGWLNLPVLGWLLLRGRTRCCNTPFSIRYPLIEAVTGATTLGAFMAFDPLTAACISLVFYILLSLSLIDHEHCLLPDVLVYPLIWIGLLINMHDTFTTLSNAVLGTVVGYLSFYLIPKAYALLTLRKDVGMGLGDAKLMAAAGAWLGIAYLPFIAVIGVFAAILLTLISITAPRTVTAVSERPVIPFGPGLSIGFFACLIGQNLIQDLFPFIQYAN